MTTAPYATGRTYYDADSHVMEPMDWLTPYADPSIRDQLRNAFPGDFTTQKAKATAAARAASPDTEHKAATSIMTAKGWQGYGAFDAAERSKALDMLGFQAQLVFSTIAHHQFWWHKDPDVVYGGARAHNRAMAEFCAADRRLLGVAIVPLSEAKRSGDEVGAAIDLGCRAVLLPTSAPKDMSPTHPAFAPMWSRLEEAGVPFMLHIGTGGRLVQPGYRNNGRPVPPDMFGGGENIRSKDFVGIHYWPETFLSMLVLDGLFERHPGLRGGCIEQGAEWVPAFLRRLDAVQATFKKTEPDVAALQEKASDYIRMAVKFTPFPQEDVGWIIEQAGAELVLFSSDYPHVEGTRDPIARFEQTLGRTGERERDLFYSANFVEMLRL